MRMLICAARHIRDLRLNPCSLTFIKMPPMKISRKHIIQRIVAAIINEVRLNARLQTSTIAVAPV